MGTYDSPSNPNNILGKYDSPSNPNNILGTYDTSNSITIHDGNKINKEGNEDFFKEYSEYLESENVETKGKEEKEEIINTEDFEKQERFWKICCSQLANLNLQPGRVLDGGIESSIEKIKEILCDKFCNNDLFEENDFEEVNKQTFLTTQLEKIKEIILSYGISFRNGTVEGYQIFSEDGISKIALQCETLRNVSIENPSFSIFVWAFLGKDKKWKYFYATEWAANF